MFFDHGLNWTWDQLSVSAFNYDVDFRREKLNVIVWAGLCGNGLLLGPFFFENNMNGNGYLQILNEHVIPELMENFPVQQRGVFRRLWWAQDGAPAHRLVAVRNRLAEVFGHRVIALYHDVEWPSRSPDLTCCDFFSLGLSQEQSVHYPST